MPVEDAASQRAPRSAEDVNGLWENIERVDELLFRSDSRVTQKALDHQPIQKDRPQLFLPDSLLLGYRRSCT